MMQYVVKFVANGNVGLAHRLAGLFNWHTLQGAADSIYNISFNPDTLRCFESTDYYCNAIKYRMESYTQPELLMRLRQCYNENSSLIAHDCAYTLLTNFENESSAVLDALKHLEFHYERNDTKHRKRAFTKRGYWRRKHAIERRANSLKYAYFIQGIDYDSLERLKIGEIPILNK